MHQKNIIVTGGSRGIGKAIIEALLRDPKTHVYTCSKTDQRLEQLRSDLGNPENLHIFPLDLADEQAVQTFTATWHRPLYGIVNNAGICEVEYLTDDKPDVWKHVLAVNLTAPMLLVKGLHKQISDGGRIVNISSQLGKEGRAGYSAYAASKFGLIGLTKTWAYELGKRGITVNAVCPGWVATEMSIEDTARIAKEEGYTYDEYYTRICAQLELKRFTEPSEVAGLVDFLLSESGSGVTGRDWLLNVVWNQD